MNTSFLLFIIMVVSLKLLFNKRYELRDLLNDGICGLLLYANMSLITFIVSVFITAFWVDILFTNMYIKNRVLIQRK